MQLDLTEVWVMVVREGPMVRIRLPPAESRTNFRLSEGGDDIATTTRSSRLIQRSTTGTVTTTRAVSGMRGVLNDALSIYFGDPTLASAFVARSCVGAKVEPAGGRVPGARG